MSRTRQENNLYIKKYRKNNPIKTRMNRKCTNANQSPWIEGKKRLSIKDVQSVYEENIKHFGTLTCIYCLNLIEFGEDTLEHKIPLSRGGENNKENLGIACSFCNKTKQNKTYEEFMEHINQ